MNRIVALLTALALVASIASGALVNKYVSVTGAGTKDGNTDGNSMSWAEMKTYMSTGGGAQPGWVFNVKAGTYTLAATDTWTIDGTAASPIVIQGYNSTFGDLKSQGHTSDMKSLNTTNYPVIAYNSGYQLNANGSSYLIFTNLKLTGTVSEAVLKLTSDDVVCKCSITNASTNAAATCLYAGAYSVIEDCDFTLSGGSGTRAAVQLGSANMKMKDCRILAAPNWGIYDDGRDNLILRCVINTPGKHCIYRDESSTGYASTYIGNTLYQPASGYDCIAIENYAYTHLYVIMDNYMVDSGGCDVNNLGSATRDLPAFIGYNRTRDNAHATAGFTDWLEATSFGLVTTDTGDATTDFVSPSTGDFRLIRASPGREVASLPYLDIGALQRREPNLPDVGDVKSGVTMPRDGETTLTGTYSGGVYRRPVQKSGD